MSIPRKRFWGVLMAGGYGERLWPWSRRDYPKQFLTIAGRQSLLQASYARLTRLCPADQVFIIGNEVHRRVVREHLPRLPRTRWVGEPVGRNTAVAIGIGAFLIGREDPGAVMVVATADHVIEPAEEWVRSMRAAAEIAPEDVDRLICIGIPPTEAATGYGYLVPGRQRRQVPGTALWARSLARFVEKPATAVAQQLIRRGALWNSGMFIWSIPAIARALQRHLPQVGRAIITTIKAEPGTPRFRRELAKAYERMPSISIDYGVMEHAEDRWMVPATFSWDDVGSWTSAWRYLPLDSHGNAVRGCHAGLDTKDSLILGDPDHLIGTIGVKDLVVIQRGNVTLVVHASEVQRVRQLVTWCEQQPAWRQYL